jgi:hypothetical protein
MATTPYSEGIKMRAITKVLMRPSILTPQRIATVQAAPRNRIRFPLAPLTDLPSELAPYAIDQTPATTDTDTRSNCNQCAK